MDSASSAAAPALHPVPRVAPASVPSAVPPALADCYRAVRAAWAAGRSAGDPGYPPLGHELTRLARAARMQGVPASGALRILDAVCRPAMGGDPWLDWDHVREWAGRTVIRAYYRDD